MSLTVVVSGLSNYSSQAQAALTAAGFRIVSTEEDHGLPVTASGEEPQDGTHTLVTVEGNEVGDDLDAAVDAVSPFGWVLRLHRETPPPPPPVDLSKLAPDHPLVLKARIDALEARLP